MALTQYQGSLAFTVKYNGIARTLTTQIGVSEAFDPFSEPESAKPPTLRDFSGIWDTGATSSVITEKVVADLGLKSIDETVNYTAGGERKANVYLVNVRLPNNVVIPALRVVDGEIKGADVLIGMDVIGVGDFSVTNRDSQTWMTFSMPSVRRLDFVEEHRQNQQ